jgi:hypothetical protein
MKGSRELRFGPESGDIHKHSTSDSSGVFAGRTEVLVDNGREFINVNVFPEAEKKPRI